MPGGWRQGGNAGAALPTGAHAPTRGARCMRWLSVPIPTQLPLTLPRGQDLVVPHAVRPACVGVDAAVGGGRRRRLLPADALPVGLCGRRRHGWRLIHLQLPFPLHAAAAARTGQSANEGSENAEAAAAETRAAGGGGGQAAVRHALQEDCIGLRPLACAAPALRGGPGPASRRCKCCSAVAAAQAGLQALLVAGAAVGRAPGCGGGRRCCSGGVQEVHEANWADPALYEISGEARA